MYWEQSLLLMILRIFALKKVLFLTCNYFYYIDVYEYGYFQNIVPTNPFITLLVVYLFVLRAGQFDSSIRAFYTSLIQDAIPDSERETQLHCLDYLSLYLNT